MSDDIDPADSEVPPTEGAGDPARFQTSSVASWSCLSTVLLVPLGFLLSASLAVFAGDFLSGEIARLLTLLLPGLVGAALIPLSLWRMSKAREVAPRSMWAGISIGAAVFLVVFAGVCGPFVGLEW